MTKFISVFVLFLIQLSSHFGWASAPDWTFLEQAYQYTVQRKLDDPKDTQGIRKVRSKEGDVLWAKWYLKSRLSAVSQQTLRKIALLDSDRLIKTTLIEDSDTLWLMMEPALEDMFDATAGQPLVGKSLRSFMRQTTEGLKYLHDHGICHRDLKPENILAFGPHLHKIADFDFACEASAECTRKLGTFPYMAPEMWIESQYDCRSTDLWALGATFYMVISQRFLVNESDFLDFVDFWNDLAKHPDQGQARISKILGDTFLSKVAPWYKDSSQWNEFGQLVDLIKKILKVAPADRLSLVEILDHPFMKNGD